MAKKTGKKGLSSIKEIAPMSTNFTTVFFGTQEVPKGARSPLHLLPVCPRITYSFGSRAHVWGQGPGCGAPGLGAPSWRAAAAGPWAQGTHGGGGILWTIHLALAAGVLPRERRGRGGIFL